MSGSRPKCAFIAELAIETRGVTVVHPIALQLSDNAAPMTEVSTDTDEDVDTARGIGSFELGLNLLTLLAESEGSEPPMLKTLAAAAGMSPAKAHRYMVSLVRMHYAEKNLTSGRYKLGPRARQLGITSLQSMDVVKVAGRRLQSICAELRFSVALAVWSYYGPVIVATEDHKQPVTISTRVGEVLPILSSATGRVFGAWLANPLVARLISDELSVPRERNEAVPSTRLEVDKLFQCVRDAGVGWVEGGLNATINGLAAPIFDLRGGLAGALVSLGPSATFSCDIDGKPARLLRAAAQSISRELGYHIESQIQS